MLRLLVLLSALAAAAVGAQDWEVSFHEDGVLVETRAVADSKFKAFRAQTLLSATPEEVLARLRDVARYPEWFPDTLEARMLSAENGIWLNYVRTDAPWPVKDRDAVYRNQRADEGDTIRIEIETAPAVVPESRDAVRVQAAKGFWEMKAVESGTEVRWEFHMEPGGSVPANLANKRVVDTPRRALLALRDYFIED